MAAPALRCTAPPCGIAKGERIGVRGDTGSGKSTLLDLLMGLIEPTHGEIRVDGRKLDADARRAWQANIAHVPQSIYMIDDSIAANVTLGIPPEKIDRARLAAAVQVAQLEDVIAQLPEGYDTIVGERGIRVSGGQRQRIGLARALYREASILVLDEATSALDPRTEARVIAGIMSLPQNTTIVIVSHRESALNLCDRRIDVTDGALDHPPQT